MRIIKVGAIKPKPEQETQCPNCDTIFAFTSEDVRVDWDGGNQTPIIECPYCHYKQVVASLK